MDANVLKALNDANNDGYRRPSLNNIIIYGRVRCLIDRPSFLGEGVKSTNGYFALLDAYALKCLGEDYFREDTYDVNSIYFTKGSVLIYIDSPSWVGKDVKVFGKSKYYGANIRRQKCKSLTEGISAFMFGAPEKNGRYSVYPLVPNVLVELNAKDADARGTVLEDFIVTIANDNIIPYPETLECIIPYTGVNDYNELVVSENESKNITSVRKNFVATDDRVDISKIDMHLVNHLEGQPLSEYYDVVKEDFNSSAEMRYFLVTNMVSELNESYEDNRDYLEDGYFRKLFIENVVKYPLRKLGVYGKEKVKNYVDIFTDNCEYMPSSDLSEIQKSQIARGMDKLKKAVYTDNTLLSGYSGDEDIDVLPVLQSDFLFTLNVIGVCTGIGFSTLNDCIDYCVNRYHFTAEVGLYALIVNPYLLGLLGTGLSVVDCDIIYNSIGNVYTPDEDTVDLCNKYRFYLLMLDTLDNCANGIYYKGRKNKYANTFVNKRDYKRADCKYPEKALNNISSFGFISSSEVRDLLSILLGIDIYVDSKFNTSIKKWYDEDVFNELVEKGVINTVNNYCALQRDLERELLIYETFEEIGKKETGISDETIEGVIERFEKEKGFALEPLQKEGIKLCKHHAGVLSGCAGSGKTTTSDCLTEALKTLDDVKIVYCTPTGKACRRLAEVVHSTVKTIHSQFNVMLGGASYLQRVFKRKNKIGDVERVPTVYILDEMAMCSTELLYNVAKSIEDIDMVYFLGDVKQLPPIGRGCPFKVLMNLLPCVELGVSKRAAEGSLINYNTSLINFMSTPICRELKYDNKTFIAKDCDDLSIISAVRSVFNGFMSGKLTGVKYSEDDIQVISGYQAKEKVSSTNRLNIPLQADLRKYNKVLYYRESRNPEEENKPFYEGDRVIYVNRNSYDMCRYVLKPDGTFHQTITFGCVNGEMGKLVGVVPTKDLKIHSVNSNRVSIDDDIYSEVSNSEFSEMLERFKEKEESMRNDSVIRGDNLYFVVIKVYDTDLRKDVYVLLRATGRFVDSDFCLSGSDLGNLSLAYALTCHKMQGSQNKVIIAVFESKGNPDFINRNMINTIITRSQEVVCCIGSVTGEDSLINRGRLSVSNLGSHDLLSWLTGDDSWIEG